jgi:hypothetical protein
VQNVPGAGERFVKPRGTRVAEQIGMGTMARILVTEEIAEGGLDRLRADGHEVDVRLGLSPEELLSAVPGAHALIIRSATDVTDASARRRRRLMVVGRAGIGLDNVDVDSATRRRDGGERAPVEHRVGGGAHDGAVDGLGPQRPQAHAALRRRPVGAQPLGRRRAAVTRRSASSVSVASASSSPSARRLRHAADRL